MADKTTGELPAVKVGDLPLAPDVYDDALLPVELQGSAMHVTGAQWKRYAVAAVKDYSDSANRSASAAQGSAERAETAMESIHDALNNLPAGGTVVINDLTTGGTTAALSAEMGKELNQKTVPITRKINGKDLSSDVVLYASDVGASNVNPNLLHNWYFANCVNQRGGELVVPPNTPWFTSLSFSTQGGRTDGYYVYTPYNDICGSIQIGDVTGYVAAQYLVRRYVGGGYTIDRWKLGSSGAVLIEDGYISFDPLDGIARNLEQQSEVLLDTGMYSLSALFENAEGAKVIVGVNGGFVEATCPSDEKQVVNCAFFVSGRQTVTVYIQTTKKVKIYAIKLELGSTQTLAHQDENGNWVLNEIPDYNEELAKCQRYYQKPFGWIAPLVNSEHYIVFKLPLNGRMRIAATASNVTLDATKLFIYNSAVVEGFTFAVHGGNADYLLLRADKTSHGLPAGSAFLIAHDGGIIADANL